MQGNRILGKWKSVAYMVAGGAARQYDKQEITFYDDGTGAMHARTLFKRNTPITWEFDGHDFYIYNLGGPGSIAIAALDGNELVVVENGMLMVYSRA